MFIVGHTVGTDNTYKYYISTRLGKHSAPYLKVQDKNTGTEVAFCLLDPKVTTPKGRKEVGKGELRQIKEWIDLNYNACVTLWDKVHPNIKATPR